ncbi:MAG TPA: Gfo/Idh/MocA family oxidoreductase [Phycisphaerae bacterium]|nr:Gfo/Idh/MocA family oxidoreductase [Phycisphaerae bacterium]
MADVIRVGMIGADTSHCMAYTNFFHDPKSPDEMKGFRVVACYPSFSPDLKPSADRVEEYKKALVEKHRIRLTDSIEEMLEQVDRVLLVSVDGRRHLKELIPVARAGKPCYVDKPFAASLKDALEMVKVIKDHKLPCFSSSSLRFDSTYINFLAEMSKEKETAKNKAAGVLGCDAYSPASLEPTNPGFFWYGIHGVEILYTLMGPGCVRVACSSTPDGDMAVGVWKDGRIGTFRGIRKGPHHYGATALTAKGIKPLPASGDFYKRLCLAIAKFFRTKEAPVPIDETLELCAFIDGALRSSEKGGCDVEIGL